MNEVKKTGLFWAAAGVSLAIAAAVAWPTASRDDGGVTPLINTDLFTEFKDPLTAASMKIVTFDEEQGKLATFEVRKDRESGNWTIPSRDGYPADAVEQMKDAANALVGLKILDVQTENAEDHDDLGVAEPKLEDLEVGDTGVGRLVTFKDEAQNNLASIIIGDPVKDREGQRYVRKPGQDPVYVVKLDDTPLSTQFNAWIEDDLLQLSSIDIENIEIKDYNASLGLDGFSLTRNYNAKLSMEGSQWELDELLEFDNKKRNAAGTKTELKEGEKLNTTKLNDLKNALDDLKIADVVRKPKGMSENLRADKELVSDNEAVASLAQRGFYPAEGASGEIEILSANGELTIGLKDGVQYLMRFGNVSGVSDEAAESQDEEAAGGVNRYLLVTTLVDESKFPAPDLKPVPQSLEELKALLETEGGEAKADEPAEPATDEPATDEPANVDKEEMKSDEAAESESTESESTEPESTDTESADAKPDDAKTEGSDSKKEKSEEASKDSKTSEPEATDTGKEASADSGETEAAGAGEASVSGGALQEEDKDSDEAEEKAADDASKVDADDQGDKKDVGDKTDGDKPAESKPEADEPKADDQPADTEPAMDPDDAIDQSQPVAELDKLTDEEKQERLEAEQEKITKENQRKLDERKDKIDAAKRKVRDLNARFADWYYVITEETYSKLRISRSDLAQSEAEAAAAAPPAGMPPGGFPGGFPGN